MTYVALFTNLKMADYYSSSESELDDFEALSCTRREVQGYMHEPIRKQNIEAPSDDEDNSTDDESSEDERPERAGHNGWCGCEGRCSMQRKGRESLCCWDYSPVQAKMESLEPNGCVCITLHPGFTSQCLDPYTLERSMKRFIKEEGPIGNDQPIHKLYRYLAYRNLVEWCWIRLGHKKRLPLPVCARDKIRETWPDPDGNYTGFKYPDFS